MQHYLREQPDDIHSFNIVEEMAVFLQMFYTELNEDTMELVYLVLQALTKLCVGNFPNQEVILNCHIIDAINGILDLSVSGQQNATDIKNVG